MELIGYLGTPAQKEYERQALLEERLERLKRHRDFRRASLHERAEANSGLIHKLEEELMRTKVLEQEHFYEWMRRMKSQPELNDEMMKRWEITMNVPEEDRGKALVEFNEWTSENFKFLNCIRPAYCLCKACQFK